MNSRNTFSSVYLSFTSVVGIKPCNDLAPLWSLIYQFHTTKQIHGMVKIFFFTFLFVNYFFMYRVDRMMCTICN